MDFREQLVKRRRIILFLLMPLLSLLLHIHIFTKPLAGTHCWRQCETASNVMRFAREGHGIADPHVYSLLWEDGLKRMEFPIMQWVMAKGMQVFGEHVIVMRIISWLIGLAAIWGFFVLVKYAFDDDFIGLLGAWCFSFSPAFFYYNINVLPDNLALSAGIWGLALFLRWFRLRRNMDLWLSAATLMLATAAKLPFILFYSLPAVWLLFELFRSRFGKMGEKLHFAIVYILSVVPAGLWYLWVIPQWTGNGIVKGVLETSAEDLPELMNILLGNLISVLPELLVNYAALAFFLGGIFFFFRNKNSRKPLFWPFVLWALFIFAYFIFEINMITTVHDYYLFPFLPGIFLLTAYGARALYQSGISWLRTFTLVALLALPVTACLRTFPRWNAKGDLKVLLENRDELRKEVPENALLITGHDISPHIFLYHLQRKGWNVSKHDLDAEKIALWMEKGATHLLSSTREIDEAPHFKPYLGELEAEIDQFRLYRLHK